MNLNSNQGSGKRNMWPGVEIRLRDLVVDKSQRSTCYVCSLVGWLVVVFLYGEEKSNYYSDVVDVIAVQ